MARSISASALAKMQELSSDAAFLVLLTIDEEQLDEPIRVVNNTENIESRGDTYYAFPFGVKMPTTGGESLPTIRLTIDGVDQSIIQAIQLAKGRPEVTMEIIESTAPDDVEVGPMIFSLESVEAGAISVSGELTFEDAVNATYPAHRFDPATAPGLF